MGALIEAIRLVKLPLVKENRMKKSWDWCVLVIRTLICCALICLPYFAFERYALNRLCHGGVDAPAWCSGSLKSVYAHMQSTYWQVGFLRYFQFKQIPNFLL